MGVALSTAKDFTRHIRKKLGALNRTHAVAIYQNGHTPIGGHSMTISIEEANTKNAEEVDALVKQLGYLANAYKYRLLSGEALDLEELKSTLHTHIEQYPVTYADEQPAHAVSKYAPPPGQVGSKYAPENIKR